ncbi:MAG: Serine protease HtrA (DegP protein) [uncultured Nocardioidaceae bacterium]|uniref:Serine protease HtrA (DegP protein) n=1 Tax=uncultured Nocardioidaceae bacterium TaxID=253824 RepID=A0A6J4M013_9ACTN|nr:MAG: Serine protease HtrA (DegP protein) [uncultured Nocardioidaceae bacterium]
MTQMPRPSAEPGADSPHQYPHADTYQPSWAGASRTQQPADRLSASPGRRLPGFLVAAALLAGLVGGVGGATGYDALSPDDAASTTNATDRTVVSANSASNDSSDSVQEVSEKVLPSVVQINVRGQQGAGSGSGIVLSSDGQVLTNNHVVEAAAEQGTVTVAFPDGTTAPAEIVGRDPLTDLAVIQAEGTSGLTPATLGSSSDLAVGQEVVAIGSPYGLESTVTTGIVSALNRPVTSGSPGEQSTSVFPGIQTDAAINPGNSGGPLVNTAGQVVGINSAIRTSSSGSDGSIGLGFAIPIDLARSVAGQLSDGQTATHAEIGVQVTDATASDGVTGIGAAVEQVNAGTAADEAGLRGGDVVTGVDDQSVTSADALVAAVRGYRPGDTVTLTLQRGDQELDTRLTLGSDGA